jgi:hypothetical protein
VHNVSCRKASTTTRSGISYSCRIYRKDNLDFRIHASKKAENQIQLVSGLFDRVLIIECHYGRFCVGLTFPSSRGGTTSHSTDIPSMRRHPPQREQSYDQIIRQSPLK